eukprot:TRINITY_DN4344_c0_g1_i1.p1 TRINITY_DN4344_c0_g1~~TRINITY_DN4344_c0_g1_i1.p1  ORF type:complete len:384 (-),score=63.36 TRINITY_DN4344_c0_g1_i1:8-1159(-)
MAPYLCYFFHAHLDFRLPELESVALLTGSPLKILQPISNSSPFLMIDLPSDDYVKLIASRAILVKGIFEVWGRGTNYEELLDSFRQYPVSDAEKFLCPGKTFKMKVKAFGKSFPIPEQKAIINKFTNTPFTKGKVSLKNPTTKFWVVEEVGEYLPINTLPKQILLLREIAKGQKKLVDRYTLKKRKYLGTTSMDAQLSLVLANQAHAQSGSFIYDPFVGTGSLLITCSHFGAITIGSDINPQCLRGKTENCNVKANFLQYQISSRLLDLFVHDHSISLWRPIPIFDAIVSDPPYGIREGARKIGRNPADTRQREIPEELRETHVPTSVEYSQGEIFSELVLFAAKMLKVGGRLVFWFPAITATYSYIFQIIPFFFLNFWVEPR